MNEHLDGFGVTNDGNLWHTVLTIKESTEAWTAWEDVQEKGAGSHTPFVSVDSAYISELLASYLHMCGITDEGKLLHTVPSQLGWQPFEDITPHLGDLGGELLNVKITGVGSDLHICILALIAYGEQHILHTVLHKDGSWERVEDVNALPEIGSPGSFISIDCAGVGNDLHICGVTEDGKLWHTMRSFQNNNWTPFEDVETLSTGAQGPFTDVSLAEGATDLHVLAQSSDGMLWHTIRSSAPPSWQATFDNVKALAGDPGSLSSVDCTGGKEGLLHISVLTQDEKLWHTIRFPNPLVWTEFEDVTTSVVGMPGPFQLIRTAAIIIEVGIFSLTVCSPRQDEVYRDCYIVSHSNDPNIRAGLKQRVRSLLADPCANMTVPPGCLP